MDTLRGDGGAPAADLGWIGPVTAQAARRIACDAAVTPVVVDARGMPLVIGPEVAMVPPSLRRALAIRDGGCIHPGCDRPPAWTDAHHLVYRCHGGQTVLANLDLLCRPHHVDVHRRAIVIRRTDDGAFEFVDPHGTVRRRDPMIPLSQLPLAIPPRPPIRGHGAAPPALRL